MKKVLIAYVSKTGTTAEIVHVMTKVLMSHDLTVEAKGFDEVSDLKTYDAVIIGAPINGMRWVPEASQFCSRFESELKQKKVAMFAVSYLIIDGRETFKKAIRNSLTLFADKTGAVATTIFSGRIEKEMPRLMGLLFGLKKGAPLDYLDLDKVKEWTIKITDLI